MGATIRNNGSNRKKRRFPVNLLTYEYDDEDSKSVADNSRNAFTMDDILVRFELKSSNITRAK